MVNRQALLKFVCCFALFLFSAMVPSAAADNTSSFVSVKLPRGIELQIPKNWWLLSAEHNKSIKNSIEAVVDLSGIGLPSGQETNLIAANSMPRSTYASVRVDSIIPASVVPSDFESITATDVHELQTEIRQLLQKILPLQGSQLLEFFGTRIETISGHPVIVTEYRRSGPKGPVFVQTNRIFTPSQEINIHLSYREMEVALWKPVVGKIRKSIVIKRWP